MTYEQPKIETYGSVDDLTEQVDDGYGSGGPAPPNTPGQ